MANSSQLSLPSVTAPGPRQLARPRWRRTASGSPPACASRRWWRSPAVTKMSLCASGTPGERRRRRRRRCARRRRGPAPAWPLRRCATKAPSASCASARARKWLRRFDGRDLALAQAGGQLATHASGRADPECERAHGSLDHLRHQEQAASTPARCAGWPRAGRLARHVVAQAQRHVPDGATGCASGSTPVVSTARICSHDVEEAVDLAPACARSRRGRSSSRARWAMRVMSWGVRAMAEKRDAGNR